MTVYEFAIARAYAQLETESRTRQLTPKEKGTLRVLKDSVARYRAREAVEAAAQ
jgi:hypothetical protein